MEETHKHYIRVDQTGLVTKIFSTAFEQPEPTDICINEDGTRILPPELMNIYDETGAFKYAWDGVKLIDGLGLQLGKVRLNKIASLDLGCSIEISMAYPIAKQMNISARRINRATGAKYTDQDQADMDSFIDNARSKLQNLEQAVSTATTLEQIMGVTWQQG